MDELRVIERFKVPSDPDDAVRERGRAMLRAEMAAASRSRRQPKLFRRSLLAAAVTASGVGRDGRGAFARRRGERRGRDPPRDEPGRARSAVRTDRAEPVRVHEDGGGLACVLRQLRSGGVRAGTASPARRGSPRTAPAGLRRRASLRRSGPGGCGSRTSPHCRPTLRPCARSSRSGPGTETVPLPRRRLRLRPAPPPALTRGCSP